MGQGDRWYPSRWGANDQRGAANDLTPAKVLEAKNMIRTGTVYQLGHVYESSMPLFGTRHFSLRIPQTFGPMGSNNMMYHDEVISGELGQVGTQFDTFSHQMIGTSMYNCYTLDDTATRAGFTKLGVEQVGALITRGVLIDVAVSAVPEIEVVFLDTQYHFAETLWFVERVRDRYGLNLTVVEGDAERGLILVRGAVPVVEQVGIDEGYLDLGSVVSAFTDARAVATVSAMSDRLSRL